MQRLKVNIIKYLFFFHSDIVTLATSKRTQWTFFEIILLKSAQYTDRNALYVVFHIHKTFDSKFPQVGLCLDCLVKASQIKKKIFQKSIFSWMCFTSMIHFAVQVWSY